MNSADQTTSRTAPGAWKECVDCWTELPDKTIFLVLVGAWVALFHFLGNSTLGYVRTPSLFGWWIWVNTRGLDGANAVEAFNRILSADEAHVWFVPLVVLALLGWKRRELAVAPKRFWWPALGLVAVALLIHVLGYMVQQTRVSLVAFFLGGYALSGLVWGWSWLRATFFPAFLLLGCIPLGNASEYIAFPLRLLATNITTALARGILGIDVVQNGTSIWDPSGRFQYEVAAACSGIRSLTAIFGLATIYGFVKFSRTWQRLLLMATAFPLAVLGNVIRVITIVLAAESFGQPAGDYVHQNAVFSLLPYLPAIAGLMVLGHWLRKFKFQPRPALKAKPA